MGVGTAFVWSALALAWISFSAFLVLTYRQLTVAAGAAKDAQDAAAGVAKNLANPAVPKVDGAAIVDFDPAKLFENAAKLVDSLTKASPGLAALAASVLFLAIAAYGIQKPSGGAQPGGGASTTTEIGQKNAPAQ